MLKEKIKSDLKEGLKARREIEVSTLRMVLASILNKEKEKRYKIFKEKPEFKETELEKESELTDEEIIQVLFSEQKKRKEAILEFGKGKRQDLVEKETKEMEILEKYLPEQPSEQELKKMAMEAISQAGAKELKDMGKVMANLMPKLKGKVQGGQVSEIVKSLLKGGDK
jgi:hypothetical protein